MAPTISIEYAGNRESKKFSQKLKPSSMGKTRKVSEGNSRGFVPEYCHSVDDMVELNPCSPKRKFISLNDNANERFGVPIQVLYLSKLSGFQRKELVLKLKHELEQVRTFQKEVAMGKSTPKPVSNSIKRVPSGKKSVGSTKKAKQTSGNAMLMKQCETLLKSLIVHTHGWVFKAPVDAVALNIPDYYTVIKHPMDLGTVKSKLTSGQYIDPLGFAADVRLTFSNALTYNPRGNNVNSMAETLSKYFETRWKQIEKKLVVKVLQKPTISTEVETIVIMSPIKKRKIMYVESEVKQVPVAKRVISAIESEAKQVPVAKRVISAIEKDNLTLELDSLLADLPQNIIDFLKEKSCNGNQTSEDEIEIDIETMSDDTLLILRKLLDDYLSTKQKDAIEAGMELHNEVGINSSPMQVCKAGIAANDDEDLDIGGNDLAISSFPTIEIEKDSAVGKSNCGNESSSSSEDGSSSSDSDAGTSSESDADCAKASTVVNNVNPALGSEKETVTVDAEPENHSVNEVSQVLQKSRSNPVSGEIGESAQSKRQVFPVKLDRAAILKNYSVNEVSQVVQKSRSNPASGEIDGESPQSKRQVSPIKLDRAAILKDRFADTILKAQEKTIRKGEKQDLEKLRLERELLEKHRKAEKARLQAEAKAAEEARRNAEAEAAAKVKRKRELEREAARQALQNMEKTVYIDESSQFLEDLEMLGVPPIQPLQSLIDETSPVHSLDPLGSFKFPGKNPLEQLGLYMKDDEEEEDATAMIDDPEEGEID